MKKLILSVLCIILCINITSGIVNADKKTIVQKPDYILKEITSYEIKVKNNTKTIDNLKITFVKTYNSAKLKIKNIQENKKKFTDSRASKLKGILDLISEDSMAISISTENLHIAINKYDEDLPYLGVAFKKERLIEIIELQIIQIDNLRKAISDIGLINKV